MGPEGQGPLPTSALKLLWAFRGIFSCPLDTQVASVADRPLGQASFLPTPLPPRLACATCYTSGAAGLMGRWLTLVGHKVTHSPQG